MHNVIAATGMNDVVPGNGINVVVSSDGTDDVDEGRGVFCPRVRRAKAGEFSFNHPVVTQDYIGIPTGNIPRRVTMNKIVVIVAGKDIVPTGDVILVQSSVQRVLPLLAHQEVITRITKNRVIPGTLLVINENRGHRLVSR